jgi:hypothetical protein
MPGISHLNLMINTRDAMPEWAGRRSRAPICRGAAAAAR